MVWVTWKSWDPCTGDTNVTRRCRSYVRLPCSAYRKCNVVPRKLPFPSIAWFIILFPVNRAPGQLWQLMAYRDNSTGRASLRGWCRPAIVEIMRSSNKLAFLVPPDYDKSVVASVRPRKVRKTEETTIQRWRTIFKNFKRESMHDVQDTIKTI